MYVHSVNNNRHDNHVNVNRIGKNTGGLNSIGFRLKPCVLDWELSVLNLCTYIDSRTVLRKRHFTYSNFVCIWFVFKFSLISQVHIAIRRLRGTTNSPTTWSGDRFARLYAWKRVWFSDDAKRQLYATRLRVNAVVRVPRSHGPDSRPRT